MMEPQTPAHGILKTSEWGDMKCYNIVCSCGDDNHTHRLVVEAEDHGVTAVIYTTSHSKFWSLSRWRQMWQLMTQGYIECEVSIVMEPQHALNYGATLIQAVKDVEDFSKNKKTWTNS